MEDKKQKSEIHVFDRIMEAISFLRIVISPFIFGIISGGIIYTLIRNKIGLTIGIIVVCLGLIAGIIAAIRIKKKYGTLHFMSRVNASPELDHLESNIVEPESLFKQYDRFELSKDINPAIKKGMNGVILEVFENDYYEVEFVKEDGSNYEYEIESTFTIDKSFIGRIIS